MFNSEILDILQEECAEVIQATSKIRRFGWDSCHPFQDIHKSNKDHLVEELGDLLALIEITVDNFDLDPFQLDEAKKAKYEKLKKWSNIISR